MRLLMKLPTDGTKSVFITRIQATRSARGTILTEIFGRQLTTNRKVSEIVAGAMAICELVELLARNSGAYQSAWRETLNKFMLQGFYISSVTFIFTLN